MLHNDNLSPHDNWAQYYDFVYQQTFGNTYMRLCQDTEELCHQLIQLSPAQGSQASVLDVGAGTGRVAIPLLKQGHQVTAVEPSRAMCEQITRKIKDIDRNLEPNLRIIQTNIQDENIELPHDSFDLALCVFTVIPYILEEDDLERAIENITTSLRQNGLFLMDLPQQALFTPNIRYNYGAIKRQVEITNVKGDGLYRYTEHCTGVMNGEPFEYSVTPFLIRQWPDKTVIDVCERNGLVRRQLRNMRLETKFAYTGSVYYLFEKRHTL